MLQFGEVGTATAASQTLCGSCDVGGSDADGSGDGVRARSSR